MVGYFHLKKVIFTNSNCGNTPSSILLTITKISKFNHQKKVFSVNVTNFIPKLHIVVDFTFYVWKIIVSDSLIQMKLQREELF